MKKALLAFFALAAFCTCAFSQEIPLINPNEGPKDAISLVSGDASCLNDPSATFAFIISFEEAKIVDFDHDYNIEHDFGTIDEFNAGRGEKYSKDWGADYAMMNILAAKAFDKTFKSSIKLATEATDAKYGLFIRIGLFDFGHFVALGSIKDGGTITKGLVEIIELATDKTVAVFDLNYHRSKNVGYGNNDRLSEYGQLMSKEIKKLIKK